MMPQERNAIITRLSEFEARLQAIDWERKNLIDEISELKSALAEIINSSTSSDPTACPINYQSPLHEKIALLRSLFRGREEVYPRLWTSKKTGAKGFRLVLLSSA